MDSHKPTRIYAIRHGETEWNRAGRQQGHLDSPLTTAGIDQSRALAKRLRAKHIEALYCSDLGRARQTAEILAEALGLKAVTDGRLRERHLGTLQGLTEEEFQSIYPAEWDGFYSSDPDFCLPGGESLHQLDLRSIACIEELAQRHPGGAILVVTHTGVLQGLLCRALGLPQTAPCRLSLPRAALNCFTLRDGSWTLDTSEDD